MALFKILQGNSANFKADLSSAKPAFNEGYCYFVKDEQLFYIDYKDAEGNPQRKALNSIDAKTLLGATLVDEITDSDLEIPTSKAIYEEFTLLKSVDVGLSNLIDTKMDKVNPTGVGSFSLNRKVNTTIGSNSVAIGTNVTASGNYSYAEGQSSTASGAISHAEGKSTIASNKASHAEGEQTIAKGESSHSEGFETLALGNHSHIEGLGDKISVKISGGANATEYTVVPSSTNIRKGCVIEYNGIYYKITTTTPSTIYLESTLSSIALEEADAVIYTSVAGGYSSHAEGNNITASGYSSHAEGSKTAAFGYSSHAEGYGTTASGDFSHAEGSNTTAFGSYSHAEGNNTAAIGESSHAEGENSGDIFVNFTGDAGSVTYTTSDYSDYYIGKAVEYGNVRTIILSGNPNIKTYTLKDTLSSTALESERVVIYTGSASGRSSHAEGYDTTAFGDFSHAEGSSTTASGYSSHTEGSNTIASSYFSHAEGNNTTASGHSSHAEGFDTTASGNYSHTEGSYTTAFDDSSHAEGYGTIAFGRESHAEGNSTFAYGKRSHVEGYGNIISVSITGEANSNYYTLASSNSNIKAGQIIEYNGIYRKIASYFSGEIITDTSLSSTALNSASAKIYTLVASGEGSHAEGYRTIASGDYSHSEGYRAQASGVYSHAEGYDTIASGAKGHAEGSSTRAYGINSHAEGLSTKTEGENSHAEGRATTASGPQSHAEGYYTKAYGKSQHVEGEYNIADPSQTSTNRGAYVHIVGNGSSTARSNAHTLDWNGNAWFAGDVYVGSTSGTNKDEGSKKLVTMEDLSSKPNVALITIPVGKMKGDLNGDGIIDTIDKDLIFNCTVGNFGNLTSEEALALGDLDGDGKLSSNDALAALQIYGNGIKLGSVSSDLLGNWTINPNYETEDAQFYVDIEIDDITVDSSALVMVSGEHKVGDLTGVCMDGILRIFTKTCPTSDYSATVQYIKNSNGTVAFVYEGSKIEIPESKVFEVAFRSTSYAEVEGAHGNGKFIYCIRSNKTYILTGEGYDDEGYAIFIFLNPLTSNFFTLNENDDWSGLSYLTHASTHASDGTDPITPELIGAQAKITGTTGQVVGFDTNGNAIAQNTQQFIFWDGAGNEPAVVEGAILIKYGG